MKWKALLLVAAAAGIAVPSSAHACDWYLNSMFHRIPNKMALGLGIQIQPGDGATTLIPNADLAIGLGDRLVLIPAVGMCRESGEEGEEDFSEMVYGGAAALRLFSSADNKFTVNFQTGVEILSYGEAGFDATETAIPLTAAGQYMASESAAIFFGGGLEMFKFSSDFGDESDSDPVIFGGLSLMVKKVTLNGGIALRMGDETDTAINFSIKLPIGG